jgi:hypothetical protein
MKVIVVVQCVAEEVIILINIWRHGNANVNFTFAVLLIAVIAHNTANYIFANNSTFFKFIYLTFFKDIFMSYKVSNLYEILHILKYQILTLLIIHELIFNNYLLDPVFNSFY